MKVRHLSYNEVLDAYREQISKYGGFGAIRDNNALLSLIANPHREFAGRELYPTIGSKAAIFVFSMIKNHPFIDGNKRTALICGRTFLRLNGYDIDSLEGFYNLILKIAKSEIKWEDVLDWFEISTQDLSKTEAKNEEKAK